MLDWESAADIYRIKLRTDFFQLAIEIDHLVQLTPIIDIILYAFVQKDMKHFQLKLLFVSFDLVDIKFEDVFCTYTQSRRVKRKIRFFFGSNTYAEFKGFLDRLLVSF